MDQTNDVQDQIQHLASSDLGGKFEAIRILRQHRTEPGVTDAFIKALGDSEQRVRKRVAWALGTPEGVNEEVVRALAECVLEDPEPCVREAAADALAHIGPDAKGAVPQLIVALKKEKTDHVLFYVATALACIGPDARAAGPALKERAQENDDIADKCRQALRKIVGPVQP